LAGNYGSLSNGLWQRNSPATPEKSAAF